MAFKKHGIKTLEMTKTRQEFSHSIWTLIAAAINGRVDIILLKMKENKTKQNKLKFMWSEFLQSAVFDSLRNYSAVNWITCILCACSQNPQRKWFKENKI